MLLFHGSNIIVNKPRLIASKRLLDYGNAFYLTSDFEQAYKWALHTAKMRGEGMPVVSMYELDGNYEKKAKCFAFFWA